MTRVKRAARLSCFVLATLGAAARSRAQPAPTTQPAPATQPAPTAQQAPTVQPAATPQPAPTAQQAPTAQPATTPQPAPTAQPAPTTQAATTPEPPPSTQPSSDGFPPERIIAMAGLGVAIAGGVTGGVLLDEAQSRWSRADVGCDEQGQCTKESIALSREARDHMHGSIAAFVIGGAGLTTAVVLWLTSPSVTRIQRGRVALFPAAAVSPNAAAFSIHGSF